MGIVNNVFKLILLVTKLTLLSCCVLTVFCPGFQKGRVPSEKGTLARRTDRQKGTLAR